MSPSLISRTATPGAASPRTAPTCPAPSIPPHPTVQLPANRWALTLGALLLASASLLASQHAAAGQPLGTGPVDASRLVPQRYLLNALLAPALDPDSQPPTWVDPRPVMACADDAEVRVDGRPIEPGKRVPDGRFTMDWKASGCRPFGLSGPRYDGAVRLLVNHAGERWWSRVLPDTLVVTLPGGEVVPITSAHALMPLNQAEPVALNLPPAGLMAQRSARKPRQ